MAWWQTVSNSVNVGAKFRTPGRGLNGTGSRDFEITAMSQSGINIKSGKSPIKLSKDCFDAIENYFSKNHSKKLRTSSRHDIPAYKDTVDEIIRNVTGSDTSRGHYVASILEKCGLIKYSTIDGNKAICLP
jgi:hypothetical protein